MALEILKKLKSLFTGKSSAKKSPAKEQARAKGDHPKTGHRDGFSSRRERDEKRREHSEMSEDTNKVMTRERKPRHESRKPSRPSSENQNAANNEKHEQRQPRARKDRFSKEGSASRPRREGFKGDKSEKNRDRTVSPLASTPTAEFDYTSVHADNGDWTVDQFVVEPEEGKKRFHDFDIPVEIMHAISDLGFKYCTPIQAGSLEQSMAGANVAGRAQTGTGKTAAYLVSILTRYLRTPDKRNEKSATPRALVIAPTRELCVQICRDAQALGKYCGLRSLAVFGGMDYGKQASALADGTVDLLAATPGRLLDFQRQHIVDLSKIDTLVIDEADRMLDMGFIPDVRRIIRALPNERQTLLYSATLNDDVMRLAAQWMPNPVKVEIEPEKTANQSIEQKVFIVTSDQKFTILCHLLDKYAGQRVLVFGNRRVSTDALAERLRRHGYPCELLSGEVSQGHRMKVLDAFRDGTVKLVVATDVAGRGLHIADIGLVVNFELPYEAEDYVHRIGRTGRAGKVGTAVSFADEDESFIIPDIEQYIGEDLKCSVPEDELLAPLPKRERHGKGGHKKTEAEAEASAEPVAAEPVAEPAVEAPTATVAAADTAVPNDDPKVEAKPEEVQSSEIKVQSPTPNSQPSTLNSEAPNAEPLAVPSAEPSPVADAEASARGKRHHHRHHREPRGEKHEGENRESHESPSAPAEQTGAPSPIPVHAHRHPRAVVVPKGGASEQVWVPGQN